MPYFNFSFLFLRFPFLLLVPPWSGDTARDFNQTCDSKMATGGYNASYEESGPTGFGNESLDDTSASNGGKSSGFSGDSAPLVGIDYKRYELWIFFFHRIWASTIFY